MKSKLTIFAIATGFAVAFAVSTIILIQSTKPAHAAETAMFTFHIGIQGTGSGIVTDTLNQVSCTSSCTKANVNALMGTDILSATASPTSTFTGWSGDCSASGTDRCTITNFSGGTYYFTATFNVNNADLALSQTVTHSTSILTYTVVAVNNGPLGANGAIMSDTIPSGLSNPQWKCEAANGASCPVSLMNAATNSYSIYHTLPTFPVSGVVTYTISGGIGLLSQRLENHAEVIPPGNRADPDTSDNYSSEMMTEYYLLLPVIHKN
jgi:uncharacterized repeat protein (TIGR01451 family)